MNGGMAMSSYKEYKKRALQNPEVKVEYDALQLQPEYGKETCQGIRNAVETGVYSSAYKNKM